MNWLDRLVFGLALVVPGAAVLAGDARDQSAALADFEEAVVERWSYAKANGVDFVATIATLRERVTAGIDDQEFGLELQKIVALGIDGHAEVDGVSLRSREFLPFLVEPCGERFVAFRPDRSALVDAKYPYVARIDGRDLEEWLEAARAYSPRGSPQYVRRQCLRTLRDLGFLRGQLGLAAKKSIAIELIDDSKRRKEIELEVRERPPTYGVWPKSPSGIIEGKIGYLRLVDMDAEDSVREIETWMPQFDKTLGLVIDVRDNGGGARDALLKLHSLLSPKGDPPRVINCAAYRLCERRDEDHLARRYMYRASDSRWSAAEKKAIAAFSKRFRPQWTLPSGEFSEWHYLVLTRDPDVKPYGRPVIVLSNAKCFSATDIFLAGMKEIPNVTLLGEASGGGSAMVEKIELRGTPYSVVLGSMASFQVDGQLFDGVGVTPDVRVDPVPEYFVGGRDVALEEAIKRLPAR